MTDHKAKAADLLRHYLISAARGRNVETADSRSEIESIVDHIIEAAVSAVDEVNAERDDLRKQWARP